MLWLVNSSRRCVFTTFSLCHKSIVILPADKGNVTVVMNREEYDSKIKAMLDGDGYHKVKTDPTSKIEKVVNTHLQLFLPTNRRA